jgi:hypothetical protein
MLFGDSQPFGQIAQRIRVFTAPVFKMPDEALGYGFIKRIAGRLADGKGALYLFLAGIDLAGNGLTKTDDRVSSGQNRLGAGAPGKSGDGVGPC